MYEKKLFDIARIGGHIDGCAAVRLLEEIAAMPPVTAPPMANRPLALYGAGNFGRLAKEYLDRVGVPVAFVVDQNPEPSLRDPFWAGTDIVARAAVSAARKECSQLVVSVCTTMYADLHQTLLAEGWTEVVPFYDFAQQYLSVHPLNNGWYTGCLGGNVAQIEKVMARWADTASRAHHLQFIAWHSLRQDWIFETAPVTQHDRYFIPEVMAVLEDDESFLDVGGHHGEVTLQFLQLSDGRCRQAWVLEPDRRNRHRIETELRAAATSGVPIKILPFAAGEADGSAAFFEGLGYASQFSELAEDTVDIRRIDSLDTNPTFIKIHVEGHELTVLKGARKTLEKHRPIIAATSYHNHLGLWELPLWLMNTLPGYVFLLRLHSWCGTGAVIYAIPEERMKTRQGQGAS